MKLSDSRNWNFVNSVFLPVKRLSNLKLLLLLCVDTGTARKLSLCSRPQNTFYYSKHLPPDLDTRNCKLLQLDTKNCSFCNTFWLLGKSLEMKCRHLYSTRCHSKTAGKFVSCISSSDPRGQKWLAFVTSRSELPDFLYLKLR